MEQLWKDHGTKILGALVVLHSGLVASADEFHALFPPIGDTVFDLVVNFGGAALGVGVVRRGFTNARAQP